MERPKLTSARAEQLINLLRDNPGVSMTLGDLADETGIPIDEIGAHMEELIDHNLVVKDTSDDGVDSYNFPAEYQRGTTP
jgi:DNA-binding IclR family transcriptional regulator